MGARHLPWAPRAASAPLPQRIRLPLEQTPPHALIIRHAALHRHPPAARWISPIPRSNDMTKTPYQATAFNIRHSDNLLRTKSRITFPLPPAISSIGTPALRQTQRLISSLIQVRNPSSTVSPKCPEPCTSITAAAIPNLSMTTTSQRIQLIAK